ncbi:DUF6376 family protein [Ornithinibacillus scapharcae]|uniref:DUF6376 family protein n=1 Tax=Ornithinibacillus scapharcae TaxID=1147159 RepID=UPI000225B023|nr:DUF6376 family protein [Ornithinibacillus scapharcae]
MKKLALSIFSVVLFLSGCGLLEETQNTLDYATEATDYLNELNTFAEEVQNLSEGENINIEQLESKLATLEQSIESFNTLEVPVIAEGIHEDILAKNEQLLNIIHNAQENGELVLDEIQNGELYQTIESFTNFMNQIEQLGL